MTTEKITLDKFRRLRAGTIFARGEFTYNDQRRKWVAVKSHAPGVNDWAIYHGQLYDDDIFIKKNGTKLFGDTIEALVCAEPEIYKLYRR